MESSATLLDRVLLENGDRLSRQEFERRYDAIPELKKAELIEGVVHVAAALRYRSHGQPRAHIMAWLGLYAALTPGVELADNTTVRFDERNAPQPDALLRLEKGGRSQVSQDDYIEGAPELIVEIAASTASYDLYEKLDVYYRNQVQEYLVWRVMDNELDWFRWRDGQYVKSGVSEEDCRQSQVFPGLWLDVAALLGGDLGSVVAMVQEGCHSQPHQDFVAQLATQ